MKTILNIAILLSLSVTSFAQNPLRNFRDGNRLFHEGNFNEAEILFRRGLQADSTDVRGRFNLANSIYKQNEFEQSAEMFEQLLHDRRLSNRQKSNVLHNLGNSFVRTENFEEAVNSYKEAMKLNPNDDTRYNLAYALQRLQQQQQQNQDQNQQNQDQQNDQNQQQQQQQNNQNQNQQNQQQQQNQADNQRSQRQGQQPHELKQGDAERMLNAMERQEKNTLDRKRQANVQQRQRAEKDW
jgi:tetratricopeptide (TPR) repeat protein